MRLGPQRNRRPKTAGGQRGQWFTDPRLAAFLVRWHALSGLRVIDMGSGTGALTRACRAAGCTVLPMERDPRLVAMVHGAEEVDIFDGRAMALAYEFQADAVIQNAPFEDDLIRRFALRGLEFAPRVVSIMPAASLSGVENVEALWSRVTQDAELRCKRRPSFDGLRTGQQPIVVTSIRRGPPSTSYGNLIRVGYYDDEAAA